MQPAIRVEGVGKRYRVPQAEGRATYQTLRDSLTAAVRGLRRRPAAGPPADEFWALDDVSFEVQPGEVVGIIGRNGAGKSTLLKVLSRITRPTRGRVELNGRVGSLLEVGTGFHPELTGRENVYLNGAILGMSRAEVARKFDEIVAFSEVEKFLDTPVKRYSSGMYVRLAFAVAAHLEPEILIVDEVLAVGDSSFQKKCLAKMQSFAISGRTVLFVSHNMNAAAKLCRTGILLDRGRVIRVGPVGDVIREYSHDPGGAGESLAAALGRNGTGRLTGLIRSAAILNAAGDECYAFDADDEVVIRLDTAATEPLPNARIGIGINNPVGERTFACATYLSGVEVGVLTGPTRATVRFRLPGLVPGRYTVDLAVMDDTGGVLHGAFPAAAIEVTDARNRHQTASHLPEHFGHVIVPARWELTRG